MLLILEIIGPIIFVGKAIHTTGNNDDVGSYLAHSLSSVQLRFGLPGIINDDGAETIHNTPQGCKLQHNAIFQVSSQL